MIRNVEKMYGGLLYKHENIGSHIKSSGYVEWTGSVWLPGITLRINYGFHDDTCQTIESALTVLYKFIESYLRATM